MNNKNGAIDGLWTALSNTYNPNTIKAEIEKVRQEMAALQARLDPYTAVREFHRRFGHLVNETPTPLPIDERRVRVSFMVEELQEFLDADDLVDQADALADLLYFVYGTFVNIGVDPARIFQAVHEANMGKLREDGRPRYRKDNGKVIKPPNWTGPEAAIEAEIERQRNQSFPPSSTE